MKTLSTLFLAAGTAVAACAQGQATPAPATPAPATPPPASPPFTVSGYADLYYQHDFNRSGSGPTVNGRAFDNRNDQYRLALAQVDLVAATSMQRRLGFTLSLLAGPTTDLMHSTEPGGIDTYKNFGQAYATYLLGGKGAVTLDFGKFFTFIGNESNDSRSNDNYGRSFLFALLQPNYHTGLRVTGNVNSKLSVAGYAFQGWNEVEDGNSGKSFGAGASYTFSPKLSGTLQEYYGLEGSDHKNQSGSYGGIGFPMPGAAIVAQTDAILTYQWDANTKLAFNGDYANAAGLGRWEGFALYATRQLSAKHALAARFDHVEDPDGLRTGTPVQLHSLTGTYNYSVNDHLLLRVELREDLASNGFFNSDTGLKRQRTTLTFAQLIKF